MKMGWRQLENEGQVIRGWRVDGRFPCISAFSVVLVHLPRDGVCFRLIGLIFLDFSISFGIGLLPAYLDFETRLKLHLLHRNAIQRTWPWQLPTQLRWCIDNHDLNIIWVASANRTLTNVCPCRREVIDLICVTVDMRTSISK